MNFHELWFEVSENDDLGRESMEVKDTKSQASETDQMPLPFPTVIDEAIRFQV